VIHSRRIKCEIKYKNTVTPKNANKAKTKAELAMTSVCASVPNLIQTNNPL
jgi:hypothetical protein